jgi:excisionase family DNA binding protein
VAAATSDAAGTPAAIGRRPSLFMSVKEAADYLQVNEKKIYALAAQGRIPGTKVTGKWLFPRDLVEQWLIRSSHAGVFNDRLVIAGGDDPLLRWLAARMSRELDGRALVACCGAGTRPALKLLAAGRCDVAVVHWGPADESELRHPALLRQHAEHGDWVLVRAFRREQGLMLAPGRQGALGRQGAGVPRLPDLLVPGLRVINRADGSGTARFFAECLGRCNLDAAQLRVTAELADASEIAARLRQGEADVAPASRAEATSLGMHFVSAGWEAVDLALPRGLYFRTLLQRVIDALASDDVFLAAERLGGYDFPDSGRLVWAAQD